MPLSMLQAGRSARKILAKQADDRKSVVHKKEFKRKFKTKDAYAVTGADPSSVVRKGEASSGKNSTVKEGEFKRKKGVTKKSITGKQRKKSNVVRKGEFSSDPKSVVRKSEQFKRIFK